MDNDTPPPVPLRRLQEIVDGDGSDIRLQFILAGLLLTIFERFKAFVVSRVDEFFAHGFEVREGALIIKRSDEFKALIKAKGEGEPGQHGNVVFRAALGWLYEMNAIDKSELSRVERLYTLRNDIGHELFAVVASDHKEPIDLMDPVWTLHVYVKVVRWWIKEIEAATDPDMTREKYESTNWAEAESTDTLFLRAILHKSLAGIHEWEVLRGDLPDTASDQE